MICFTLNDAGYETIRDRWVSVLACTLAREEAVLEISHDPRPATRASAPDSAGTIVDGLHVAVARIVTVKLGIAVIEAAGIVVMGAVEDRVYTLRCIACSYTAGHCCCSQYRAR